MINLKNILSCAIMVLCIVSLFSCVYSKNYGDCGTEGDYYDNVKWELDDDGTLTISGEGRMQNFPYVPITEWMSRACSH